MFSPPYFSNKPCIDCGCKYYSKQDNQSHLKFCCYCGLQRAYFIKPETIVKKTIKLHFSKADSEEDQKIQMILQQLGKDNYFNTKTLTEDLIRFILANNDQRMQIQKQNKERKQQFSIILDKVFEIIKLTQQSK